MNQSPLFGFADRKSSIQERDPCLMSLAMYAKIAGHKSLRDVQYERVVLKLKDQFNTKEDQSHVARQIKTQLE